MKILIILMSYVVFFISCGDGGNSKPEGSEGGKCYGNYYCDSGLVCENGICVKDSEKDTGNTGNTGNTGDTGDTGNTGNDSDNGNTGNPDNSGNIDNDDFTDNGDSVDDEFTDDSGNTGDTGISFPWTDSETELIWSDIAPDRMERYNAVNYCENLTEGGFSDWRLPTISELRTLVQGCSLTKTEGACKVTDNCLNKDCWSELCQGCDFHNDSRYSKIGDTLWFWSASFYNGQTSAGWYLGFNLAVINSSNTAHTYYVRCVRN